MIIKKGIFFQNNIELYHFCFRMRSIDSIDKFYLLLVNIKANIIRGLINGSWVKGYYYIVFEDPDGISLKLIMFLKRCF